MLTTSQPVGPTGSRPSGSILIAPRRTVSAKPQLVEPNPTKAGPTKAERAPSSRPELAQPCPAGPDQGLIQACRPHPNATVLIGTLVPHRISQTIPQLTSSSGSFHITPKRAGRNILSATSSPEQNETDRPNHRAADPVTSSLVGHTVPNLTSGTLTTCRPELSGPLLCVATPSRLALSATPCLNTSHHSIPDRNGPIALSVRASFSFWVAVQVFDGDAS